MEDGRNIRKIRNAISLPPYEIFLANVIGYARSLILVFPECVTVLNMAYDKIQYDHR